jgi:intergrase/recombinase
MVLPGRRSREVSIVAIANYAKFLGCYDKFQQLKKRYNLKWSTSNSTQYFERFFNEQLSLDKMIDLIKEMAHKLPPHMGDIIRFGVLTGLRCSEVIESVRLLKAPHGALYYNPQRQALEHFRFPDIFLRQTKKAYISFLSTDMYQWITKNRPNTPTLNAITLACRRKGIKMDMHLTRKIHGSWLHSHGVTAEEVDFLQGRTSPSVFSRHYLAPSDNLKDRVLSAVSELQKQITTTH